LLTVLLFISLQSDAVTQEDLNDFNALEDAVDQEVLYELNEILSGKENS
jgi:hypothetical protein